MTEKPLEDFSSISRLTEKEKSITSSFVQEELRVTSDPKEISDQELSVSRNKDFSRDTVLSLVSYDLYAKRFLKRS